MSVKFEEEHQPQPGKRADWGDESCESIPPNKPYKKRVMEEELRMMNEHLMRELEKVKTERDRIHKEHQEFRRHINNGELNISNYKLDILIKNLKDKDKNYLNHIKKLISEVDSTKSLESIMEEARAMRELNKQLLEIKQFRSTDGY